MRAPLGGIFHQLLLEHNADSRFSRSAPHRIATIGATVGAHHPFLRQLAWGRNTGNGETGAHPFGHHHDVRLHPKVLKGEKLARASKARLHLVEDKQHAVLITNLAQAGQEGCRWHHVSPLTQHRLNDDRCRLNRGSLSLEQKADLLQRPLARLLRLPAISIPVRVRSYENATRQGLIIDAVHGFAGGHGHRLRSTTVEGALKDDDVGSPCVMTCQFHRCLHCLGAGVGEEETIQVGGDNLTQRLCQPEKRLVVIDIHLGMDEPSCLFLNRLNHLGVTVASIGDADARGKIQVTVAIGVPHVSALTPVHNQVGDVKPNRS